MLRSSALLLILSLLCAARSEDVRDSLTCSIADRELDPNLKPLTYDLGDGSGPQTMMAYVTPDVTTFYKDGVPHPTTPVQPEHKGLAAKFINMSNKKVRLYWQPYLDSTEKSLMRVIAPFSSTGSASFPGHLFYISPQEDPNFVLQRYEIGSYPANLYFYDPYVVEGDDIATHRNLKESLSEKERALYDGWNKTRTFNEVYRNFTGRSYLANYLREAPKHYIWPADYFGQEHWVTTKETHFVKMPPSKELGSITNYGTSRILSEGDPRHLSEYRTPNATMLNMTLKVMACAPRVFVIENFLSPTEVAHMMFIAAGVNLHESMTGDAKPGEEGPSPDEHDVRKTRTSFNSWLAREESPIVDAIYRRASDLLRIDEALMRYRPDGEHPEVPNKNSIAEHLQLVHYDLTQEVCHSNKSVII
jgi:hypothetical protein